jgi:ComF family protein
MSLPQGVFRPVIHLLFPPLCRACGAPLNGEIEGILCSHCHAVSRTILAPLCNRCGYPYPHAGEEFQSETGHCPHCALSVFFFDRARAAVCYESPYRELIHQFKFKGSWRVRPLLVNIFIEGFLRHFKGERFDGIIPVPLHWLRRFQREFNQAEILARGLAESVSIPLVGKAIRRIRYTTPQSNLSGRWRESHLDGAFAPGPTSVEGMNLLLVDDVMTTGMTLSACAEVLRRSGAASVTAYALARRV